MQNRKNRSLKNNVFTQKLVGNTAGEEVTKQIRFYTLKVKGISAQCIGEEYAYKKKDKIQITVY